MKLKTKFTNLAEEVLREENKALTVGVIIDKVAAKALSKRLSNKMLKQVTGRTATHLFRQDKRFVKTEQEEWRVSLWTLAEE